MSFKSFSSAASKPSKETVTADTKKEPKQAEPQPGDTAKPEPKSAS